MTMIDTIRKRTKDAIRFIGQNGNSTWAVLGKSSAWSDEENPPAPVVSMTVLDEPIVAIKALCYWVAPDPAGTFLFNDINGDIVKYISFPDRATAIANECNLVLVSASTLGSNIDVAAFREVGFCTDLIPASGYETATVIEAANVADWGDLETVDFKTLRSIDPTTLYALVGVMEY